MGHINSEDLLVETKPIHPEKGSFEPHFSCRRTRPEFKQQGYLGPGSIQWHGQQAGSPDWSETSQLVAFSLSGQDGGLYVAFNSSHLPVTAGLPDWPGRQWKPLLDTSKVSDLNSIIGYGIYKKISALLEIGVKPGFSKSLFLD